MIGVGRGGGGHWEKHSLGYIQTQRRLLSTHATIGLIEVKRCPWRVLFLQVNNMVLQVLETIQ